MMQIKRIDNLCKATINDVTSIHIDTFKGFFLTFMGRGFLNLMYRSYTEFEDSGLLVAFENQKPIGFLAYSGNLSELYKYMIRKRVLPFAWYSLGAIVRKPTTFMRLIRAFLKPSETRRDEKYVELASIGVDPDIKQKGVGTKLIDSLKAQVNFDEYAYITLETDAVNNDVANYFYKRNGFYVVREFETYEGRKMLEYRYKPRTGVL